VQEFLPFIVLGIVSGAVYGLAGIGLVLTYKTSGIFNFAYGSVASLSVLIFYWLHVEHGMPWPYAALLCLLVLAPIEGLLLELFARILQPVGATLKVVATVGLLLIVLGVGTLWYGNAQVSFPSFLDTSTIRVAGAYVGWDQITVVAIAVVATAVLYYFFRSARLGVAMRGVVDNPNLVAMTGENPVRLRRWAWIIGSVFASMAGLLLAPSLSLDPLVITLLVVEAFGAAAIGYFSSLPLTFVGGLFIGVASALATKYVVSVPWLAGLPVGLPFIILIIVLVVTPRARLAERRVVNVLPTPRPWQAPLRVRLTFFAVALLVFCLIPQMTGAHLSVWSNSLVDIMLFLSLGLLVRDSGQVSLCQFAFAAVGAAAFSHITSAWHTPWLVGILLAGLLTLPLGAIVAIPAIRLSGVFLAVATFGFGILLEQVIYTTGLMFGPTTSGLPAPRPDVSIGSWHLASDTGFYYVLLIFTVLTVAATIAIQRGRMGRLLRALADSPTALETHGATTNMVRVLLFCIVSAIAAIAGALTACLFSYSIGANYSSINSLILVALVVISVGASPWYAIIAAVGYTVLPGYVNVDNISVYLEIVFGVFAATFALGAGRAPTVPKPVRDLLDRAGGRTREVIVDEVSVSSAVRSARTAEVAAAQRDAELSANRTPARSREGLRVRGLDVRFGGIHAVQSLDLAVPIGQITGLVGPNGAGKTTIFNACSGLVRPTSGRVFLCGKDVTRLSASGRSRLGLGRTFQRAELFDSLSVRQNVALGREASMAGGNPATQLFVRRGERTAVATAVDTAVELTGIGALLDLQAGLLPTGQRRLVELARALAGPFTILLLDEPSSGLDVVETQRFGEVLSMVVRERSVGLLLVEHDMSLVRQICHSIYVLDFGQLIFRGTPDEMPGSSAVRAAYLGAEADPQADSGTPVLSGDEVGQLP
jgi:ABC-type branched-subunit amino acid transport system ATPase component/branched-subunit amino acid ABC-type transport system permease component